MDPPAAPHPPHLCPPLLAHPHGCPQVKEHMTTAYEQCTAEVGAGQYERMRRIMRGHVERVQGDMFVDAAGGRCRQRTHHQWFWVAVGAASGLRRVLLRAPACAGPCMAFYAYAWNGPCAALSYAA